jgi:ATP-binding protein involved in chromosome partitioning
MALKLFGKKNKINWVIGVAAGKGGVGKSSLTVNLALALQASGYRVGVLDADLYGPSIRTMLPESRLPEEREGRLVPAMSHGIACMSIAYFFPSSQGAVVRAPIANGWITRFLQNVDWGDLDFLLIDFPPGTGDIQITLSQTAELTGALLVTTPQEIALQDVRKCLYMFHHVKVPIVGVVENMSFYQPSLGAEKVYLFGKGGGEKLAMEANVPIIGKIPLDPLIGEHLDNGKSLFDSKNHLTDHLKGYFLGIAQKLADFVKSKPESDKSLAIESISQKNPHSITIQWSDGLLQECSLAELQLRCPCAGCKEKGNQQESGALTGAKTVRNVGRYALQIDFTTGCSHGIYDYELVRTIR